MASFYMIISRVMFHSNFSNNTLRIAVYTTNINPFGRSMSHVLLKTISLLSTQYELSSNQTKSFSIKNESSS